jgi:ubiquinone/menaquinone biosynthesis C-methylase UbiE
MNKSKKVVKDFGDEWTRFPQNNIAEDLNTIFSDYFAIVPREYINERAVCMDVGCGSGRWSSFIAPQVKTLYCIDPSASALKVARSNLGSFKNCIFLNNSGHNIELEDKSIDFAFSLGVLHHVENTEECITQIYNKLKPGSPLLIYLYYKFDNRSFLYRWAWRSTDLMRVMISSLPFASKKILTDVLALLIYLPLAKLALFLGMLNISSHWLPLSYYKDKSFYTMRTDSLDRFGTSLEKRFTKKEIEKLLRSSGFENISFSDKRPYWVGIGFKPFA